MNEFILFYAQRIDELLKPPPIKRKTPSYNMYFMVHIITNLYSILITLTIKKKPRTHKLPSLSSRPLLQRGQCCICSRGKKVTV